ncbi:MAG: hypothetical protein M3Z00_11055 [Actinomycetota bacterium]|nr:hypothetical protein [Actinomycetota bacterium]
MNEYRDGDDLGELRKAVDGISPDVDRLAAGGLGRRAPVGKTGGNPQADSDDLRQPPL